MSATTLTPSSATFRTRRRDHESAGRRRRPGVLAVLWTIVGLLVLAALGELVVGPARGMRSDIAAQRATVATQLETTRAQLRITEQQLALTTEQLEISEDQRRIAVEQLELARTQLEVARTQLGRTEESLAIQRRLAAVAEETLRQARELNQKTPDAASLTTPADGL